MNANSTTVFAQLQVQATAVLGITGVSDPSPQLEVTSPKSLSNTDATDPITKAWEGRVTLAAGVATLDLSSLSQGNLAAEDMDTLKVKAIALSCPNTNTASINMSPGAVNGYNWAGAASDQVTVVPGGFALVFASEEVAGPPDIAAAGVRTLDFAGTGTEVIDVLICAG